MAKIKSGDKVEFIDGRGVRREGVMKNPSCYPGGARSGKHYRIAMESGYIATIFAGGRVGLTVKKVKKP